MNHTTTYFLFLFLLRRRKNYRCIMFSSSLWYVFNRIKISKINGGVNFKTAETHLSTEMSI